MQMHDKKRWRECVVGRIDRARARTTFGRLTAIEMQLRPIANIANRMRPCLLFDYCNWAYSHECFATQHNYDDSKTLASRFV